KLLPSDDFFTVLEEQLLQCPQHHTDISALEMLAQRKAAKQELGVPALGYVEGQAREVLRNAYDTWTRLGIAGKSAAWSLPVLRYQVNNLAHTTGIELDDLIRSTTICWNGCPECLLNRENIVGGVIGELLLDKAVLDEWFKQARTRSTEYKRVSPEELATGVTSLGFGRLSSVVLNLHNR